MRASDLAALRDFDALPASAHVRLPVVMALFSVSRATVWRWCKSNFLPKPIHIGGVTFWKVGELRERLREKHALEENQPPHSASGGATSDDPSPG